jgi:radical SAM protein with 4Fe4S-binding SPASM domain
MPPLDAPASAGRLAPSFLPATAVLEMTYACNHACLFCSCAWTAPGNGFDVRAEIDVSEWKRLIGTLCGMGVVNLAFTGGEPLLKEGLEELIRFAASRTSELVETEDGKLVSRRIPPKLFLLSNGKEMTRGILDLCAELGVHLSMSLPGVKAFPRLTAGGDPGNVLRWFERAKAAGVRTTAGVTVTAWNLEELFETLSAALLAGAETLLLNRFLPGGRGLAHARELSIRIGDVKPMLETAEEVLRASNRRGNLGTELPLCLLDGIRLEHLKVGTQCSAAVDFFTVDPSGYLRVCNHSPVRLHRWTEMENLKRDPTWRRFALKEYLPSACAPCTDMTRCDAGCREAARIVSGSPDGPDPLFEGGVPPCRQAGKR